MPPVFQIFIISGLSSVRKNNKSNILSEIRGKMYTKERRFTTHKSLTSSCIQNSPSDLFITYYRPPPVASSDGLIPLVIMR